MPGTLEQSADQELSQKATAGVAVLMLSRTLNLSFAAAVTTSQIALVRTGPDRVLGNHLMF